MTTVSMSAEDGHQLWLRYQPVNKAKVHCNNQSPTVQIAKQELETYYTGAEIALKLDADSKLVAVFPARQPRPSGMEGDHLGLTHDVSRSVGINHDVRAHPFLLGSEHTQRPFNSRFGGVMQNNSLHIVHFVP